MTQKTRRRCMMTVLIMAVLLVFSACGALKPGLDDKQADMDHLMQAVIADQKDVVLKQFEHVPMPDPAQFNTFWADMRNIYDGASTYEIKLTSWNTTYTNGTKQTSACYKVTADTNAACEFKLSYDGEDHLVGVRYNNVTERKDPLVLTVQALLLIWSILCLAFGVWMLVDCIKRPIRFKVLWLILILISFALTLTVSDTSFNTNFQITWLAAFASLYATVSYFTVKLTLPVGALLYFFVRKHLKPKPDKHAPAQETEDESESASAEALTESEADAEEPECHVECGTLDEPEQ